MLIAATTTVGDMDAARHIARSVVERRLAACVQIAPIESIYRWDGALQQESEIRLVFKTTRERWEALRQAIAELHPYQLPEIHAVPLELVHAPYAGWVAEQVSTGR